MALRCSKCGAFFPIVRHVPRFVPLDNYSSSFGLEWSKHSKTQYDGYSGAPVSEDRFFGETGWPRKMQGEFILEVGSGSGRFTEQVASTAAVVISMDYSRAVDANFASNGGKENVLIVQADVYSMPFRKMFFDRLFCFGVLQHTPKPREAFLLLPDYLRPGGELVIDIYRKRTGVLQLVKTRYWVRLVTRRMDPAKLYKWCKWYVDRMWPIAGLITRLPFGRQINSALLIADYHGVHPLSEGMLKEWAILDTFDMLSPQYEKPQTLQTVKGWFRRADLQDVKVYYRRSIIVGSGKRKRE